MNTDFKTFDVAISYEDDDLFCVVKPYGMIVNNADTSRNEFTLQDWVDIRLKDLGISIENDGSDFFKRSGIVHRLDKETSGVLLIAKNRESFEALQLQFKERRVEKTYVAVCHGVFPEEANISVPVGRLPWNRMRFGVVPSGRSAVTDFKLIDIYSDPDRKGEKLSYINAYPKTGRTHQIRVHLQYSGHPIYSDELYAGRKIGNLDRKRLNRHFLHAKKITFDHPITKKRLSVDSELTKELIDFLKQLTK